MARIKGITVTLIEHLRTDTDPFGAPVYVDKETQIDNVLVSPTLSDDVINQLNLTGRKAVYTLAIPKGDTHEWAGQEVRFFGERWRVFGEPLRSIDHLTPLDWNLKVMVERYE